MIDHILPPGTTSKLIEFDLRLAADGQLAADFVPEEANTNVFYKREGTSGAPVSVGVDDGMVAGAWATGGLKRLGNGLFQFGIPNAALASGAGAVTLIITGTGLVDKIVRILLDASLLTVTTPVAATSEGGTVGDPLRITTWQHTRLQVAITIEDAEGVAVNLTGHDLSMLIYAKADPDTVIDEWTTGTELTAGNGTLAIDAPATATADDGDFKFVIRDNGTDDTIWAHGSLKIKPAPDTPAA